MRNLTKIMLIVFLSIASLSSYAKDTTIKFDKENYILSYSKKIQLGGYLNEYIRSDENLDNYTKMLAVSHYPNVNNPVEFAKRFAKFIKEVNPAAKYTILKNNKTGGITLDFLTWGKFNGTNVIEFNIFKYKKSKAKKGLLVLQYVFKNYNKNSKEYFREIKKQRFKWLKLIENKKIPPLIEKEISSDK